MKNLFIPLLFVCGLQSCVKQKNDEIILKGRVLNLSDSSTFSNTSFLVYQTWSSSYNKIEEKTTPFITDANGYFSFKYELSGRVIVLCWPAGVSKPIARVQLDMGGVSEHDFGTVYTNTP